MLILGCGGGGNKGKKNGGGQNGGKTGGQNGGNGKRKREAQADLDALRYVQAHPINLPICYLKKID